MYNEKIKIDFVTSVRRNNIAYSLAEYKDLFDKTRQFEIDNNKDIAYFDKNEIFTTLTAVGNIKEVTKYSPMIKDYKKWYKRKVDKQVMIDMPTIAEYRTGAWDKNKFTLLSDEYVTNLICMLLDNNDTMGAFLVIAYYTGIKGCHYSEIAYAKIKHINILNKTMDIYEYNMSSCKKEFSRTIQVPERFINIAYAANKTTDILDKNGRLVGQYYDSDYIYKYKTNFIDRENTDTLVIIKDVYMKKMRHINTTYKLKLNLQQIRISGFINSLLKAADFYDVSYNSKEFENIFSEIAHQFNASKIEQNKIKFYLKNDD